MKKCNFEYCPQYQFLEQEVWEWAANGSLFDPEVWEVEDAPVDAFKDFWRVAYKFDAWDIGNAEQFFKYCSRRLHEYMESADFREGTTENIGAFATILLRAWTECAKAGLNSGRENDNEDEEDETDE